MPDFLDKAENVWRTGRAAGHEQSFDLVFKGIQELQPAYAKSTIDTDNLESVFGAFEMARLTNRLGALSSEEVGKLPSAIRRVIAVTIEQELNFPVRGLTLIAPPAYERFVEFLRSLVSPENTVALMTFNYDLALDLALHRRLQDTIDYGLEADVRGKVQLLKLHGSLNWLRCGCGKVAAWQLKDYLNRRQWSDGPGRLAMLAEIKTFTHGCGRSAEDLFIVPPTWSKGEFHREIASVWRAAVLHLQEAEEITIIGYSLPANDEFFRYLFALGTTGPTRIKSIKVINPDHTVEKRFDDLLGPSSKRRFVFLAERFEKTGLRKG